MDHPERTRIPPLRKFMLGQSLPHRMRSRPFCLNTSRNNKAGRQVDMRPCPQLLRAGLNSGPTDRKDWSIVQHPPIICARHPAWFIRQHWPDGRPLIVGQFEALEAPSSELELRLGSWSQQPGHFFRFPLSQNHNGRRLPTEKGAPGIGQSPAAPRERAFFLVDG